MAEIKIPLPTNEQMEEVLNKTRVQRKTYPESFMKIDTVGDYLCKTLHIDDEGVFYGYNKTHQPGLVVTSDFETFTYGKNFVKAITNIQSTPTHVLCAVGLPGSIPELWRCPKDGNFVSDWVKVWEGDLSHGIPIWGGLKTYNNKFRDYVFFSEYAPRGATSYAYMSVDGGATFSIIYTASGGNVHIHDIAYDEYSGRIWIALGDITSDKLIYSQDLGQTWVTALDSGFQATVIIPFSRYIVLGSDYTPVGVYRFDKEKEKLEYIKNGDSNNAGEIAFINELGTTALNSYCYGGYKHNDWEAYLCFAGGGVPYNNACIIGTGDGGETFYPLFSQVMVASGGFSRSIAGVKDNKLYTLLLEPSVATTHNVIMTIPTWKDKS